MNDLTPKFVLDTSHELEELTAQIERMAALLDVRFIVEDDKIASSVTDVNYEENKFCRRKMISGEESNRASI